VLKILEKT